MDFLRHHQFSGLPVWEGQVAGWDDALSQRDRHIQTIQDSGRMGWQKATGYGRRSLGETAMFRYKAIIGLGLRARALPAQKTEARAACAALNRMTRLDMPVSQRIA